LIPFIVNGGVDVINGVEGSFGAGEECTLEVPSTSSELNTMNVASISRLGWNSSQPRSSRGLYPSLWTTAATTAAVELYRISSIFAGFDVDRFLVLRSLFGYGVWVAPVLALETLGLAGDRFGAGVS
jgi:hypothetical protein